ncbi:MAG: helix-turn-helix domain-containing protein [Defluviitaleaceae bacterium]|nr:helix-turn-helix domain-containing protein [Defluviitaleaceae bacterium]
MLENYPDIIEVPDLCNLLNICKNTAYGLLRAGKIHAFKVGNTWKIPLQSVKHIVGYKPRTAREKFII